MATPEIEAGAPFSYMTPVLVVISAPTSNLNPIADIHARHAAEIVHR